MRTVFINERQNLVDMAIQVYGSVASVIDLCMDNGLELDSNLLPGKSLYVQDVYPDSANGDNANYLNGKGYNVISIIDRDVTNALVTNDGNAIITNDGYPIGAL